MIYNQIKAGIFNWKYTYISLQNEFLKNLHLGKLLKLKINQNKMCIIQLNRKSFNRIQKCYKA